GATAVNREEHLMGHVLEIARVDPEPSQGVHHVRALALEERTKIGMRWSHTFGFRRRGRFCHKKRPSTAMPRAPESGGVAQTSMSFTRRTGRTMWPRRSRWR